MTMSSQRVFAVLLAAHLAGCGGDADVALTVDSVPQLLTSTVVILTGESFVPGGSTCPNPGDYIRIGTLGPHQLGYRNAATGVSGPVFDDLWVCNSEGGRVMHWTSNPITLAAGDNAITVTMTAGSRQSSATVTIRPGL